MNYGAFIFRRQSMEMHFSEPFHVGWRVQKDHYRPPQALHRGPEFPDRSLAPQSLQVLITSTFAGFDSTR